MNLKETLQAVVTDDDTTIEIVEVRCSETSAVKRHERTQLRRCDRENLQYHPFRTVDILACAECFNNLKTLQRLCLTLLRRIAVCTVAQLVRQAVEVKVLQKHIDCLCTHLYDELVRVIVRQQLVVETQYAVVVKVGKFFFCQEIQLAIDVILNGALVILPFRTKDAWLHYNVLFVVDDRFETLGRHTEKIAYLARKRTEIPDVRNRNNKLDVP